MSRLEALQKYLEVAANLAIVGVAVALAFALSKRPINSDGWDRREDGIRPGSPVRLKDVAWHSAERTLLLVLQPGCHFCSESAGFYQRLIPRAAAGAVQIVAVLPEEPDRSRQYLQDLGLREISEIRGSTLPAIGVRGTPTLILADRSGVAVGVWRGKLDSSKEEEVMRALSRR